MSPAEASRAAPRAGLVPGMRLGRFLWRVLPAAGLALVLILATRILDARPPLVGLLDLAAKGLLVFAALRASVREILTPETPQLRLVPMPDAAARLLTAGLSFFLSIAVFAEVGRYMVHEGGWHLSVASGLLVLRNVALLAAATFVLGATGLFRWLRSRSGGTFWGLIARFAGRILVPLVLLALLFLIVARGLGYVPLANFVARNLVITGVRLIVGVVAFHYLRQALRNALRYFRGEEGEEGAPPLRPGAVPEADPAVLGVERIAEAALRLVVVVATMLWVLDAWNLGAGGVWEAMNSPLFQGTSVTWAQVLGGIFNVVVVLAAGWLLREILTYFVFPRSTMEVGARYAILAVLRYAVIALAFVFALNGLGLDTSSLGWFFGAAGVGIGLGLQDVIGNFFSGLIMLVERPIRVGDTVQVGDAVGKVEDIRMRGTVIRTFDNTSVTIPNRQMLGERVTNLSYGMRHARVKIDLGVDYGSDPLRVREILFEVARGHPGVLGEPEPVVWFSSFNASSIDFTLLCYTDQVTSRFTVASELRFQLFERLAREGIKIPFPQLDIHVKQAPTSVT